MKKRILASGIILVALLIACSPSGKITPAAQQTANALGTQIPKQVMTAIPGFTTQVPALVTTQLPNAVNTLAAVPVTGLTFDQAYINMIAPLSEGMVQMAQIAQNRAQHPELKDFAAQIIARRQLEINQLKTAKQQWYGTSDTPSLDKIPMIQGQGLNLELMDLQAAIEKMKKAPEPFDVAFIDAIIPQYQSAITAAELAQSTASHSELKNLAEKMKDEEQKELDQLTAWRTEWFGTSSINAKKPLNRPAV